MRRHAASIARRAGASFALACALLACRPASRRAAAVTVDASPSSDDRQSPAMPPSPSESRWTLSAHDAQSHGFAPVGFSLAAPPRSMIATRFPAQGTLALFSGPPGGPLGALVEVDSLSGSDALSLRDALRTAAAVRIGSPRVVGDPETVTFGEEQRSAVPMLAGSGPARTLYCVVMVAATERAPQGLLVWLYVSGHGVEAPSCAPVLAHEALSPIASGFRVEPP